MLMVLMLIMSINTYGQYNPTNPGEPGVYYTLKLKCSPENAGSFNIGTETIQSQGFGVSLRAYTNTGFKFVQWEENGKQISTSSSFNYTMPGCNTTLVAKFEYDPSSPGEPSEPNLPKYAQLDFKVSPTEAGYLNISSSNKYEVGTSVRLQAYNYTNYTFKNWTQDGEIISTSTSFNYVVKDSNPPIIANFSYNPGNPTEPNKPSFQRKLYLESNPSNAGYFNISSGNQYTSGSSITLRAYSNKDYTFKNWTLDGDVISESYTMNYTMPDTDVHLVANYDYVYSPSSPGEPNSPTDQDLNIYGMTETIYPGQTINYPIYLRNNQDVYGMSIDLGLPKEFSVDLSSLVLSARGNGHTISYEYIENDYIRFTIEGENAFSSDNGRIFELPITAPIEIQGNTEYPISITHGVVILKDGITVPVFSRDGVLKVGYAAEGEIYARYSYDKFNNRVKFNNQSAKEATSFEWNFGDGTTSNEENPLHIYESPGTYLVKLTISDGEQTSYYEQQVLINDQSTWEASGNFNLISKTNGLRDFDSFSEFLKMLNDSKIAGDIILNIEGGQSFNCSTDISSIEMLSNIHQQLQQGNKRMVLLKNGNGSNPIIEFGENNLNNFSKEFVDLIIRIGELQRIVDVDIKLWGVKFNSSEIYNIAEQDVCTGLLTKSIDFSNISTDLQFAWNLTDKYESLSGVVENGTHSIPSMSIINEGIGDAFLKYQITAAYGDYEFVKFDVTIIVHPALVGLFTDLVPQNASQFENTNITLNWNNIQNAVYDVYLWNANSLTAGDPIIESTSNLRANVSKYCANGNKYYWQICAHNNCQEIYSDTLSFNIGSLPDLHVSKLEVGDAVAGKEMTVSWTVTNDGNGPASSAEWSDNVWLVPDVYVGTSSVYLDSQRFHPKLLKTVGNIKALEPGESYNNSVQIQLDERVYGDYWIIVTSDMHDVKNIKWQAVNNAVPNPYTPSITGTPYNYLYAETTSSYNKIYEANETTTKSDNFNYAKIKIAVPGLVDLSVPEITAVVNNKPGTENTTLGIIRIEPTPHTTLGIADSKEFYSGKWVIVTATIKNIGALKLERTTFSNVLYMSHSPNRDNIDELIPVATQNATAFLDPNGTTKVSFDVKIPFDWYGDTYFHMFADVNDQVYELASKQNNWGLSECYNFILTPSADFVPSNLKVPSTIASQVPINIQYDVKNIGPNIPTNSAWVDNFYLSKKDIFDETAILVGKSSKRGYFSYNTLSGNPGGAVLIPASAYKYYGDNYTENTNITIKDVEEGDYYLYVKVDGNNNVIEDGGEDNNLIRSGVISCRKPELSAEIVSIDCDTIVTSSTVALTWKIKNNGRGIVKNLKTKDIWYASKNQDGANPITLGSFENELFINPGEEQILRANVSIPQNASLDGVQYIFMKINTEHNIEETNYTNNQTAISKAWFHYYQEKPAIIKGTNICLANINVPSQACPTEQVVISYYLKNEGNKKVDKEISQNVYLSSNWQFDKSAVKCRVISQQGSSFNLGAEDETLITLNVEIPQNLMGGTKYLYIVLDEDNVLQESYTKDNIERLNFYLKGNLPVVELSEIQLPDSMMTSTDVTVSWKTSNIGEWNTNNLKVDVYRSNDGKWDSQDEKLATITIPLLEKGTTTNNSTTINIPDKNHGKCNIFIKANCDNNVVQSEKGTDVIFKPTTVVLSPIPDLIITSLSADGVAWSGQKITLTTKYKNQGVNATRQSRWSEDYYLAQSNILNTSSAIKIGSRVHIGALKPGEEYNSTLSLTLPPNIEGNYMIFAIADGGNAVYESDENNNQRSIPIFINGKNNSATDLTISNISAPSQINAGEMFTLKYQINNQGEFKANGMCRDVIYLSTDNMLDLDDPIVGTVSGDINIMPGGNELRSATGRISNMPEGRYYLIIKTNSTRSLAEFDGENNTAILASQVDIKFPNISLDGTTTFKTSGYYKLTIADGFENKTIGFYLNQDKGNTGGLYVSYESVPTTATYDECSTRPNVEQQEVVIPNVKKGNYYILAQDNSVVINRDNRAFTLDKEEEAKQVPLTLSTKELHFGASSLSISKGGNGGWISTNIKGAFLDSIMDFRLENKESVIPVEILHFKNSTSSVATFNLNNADVGQYDVISELPNGTKATLSKGFSVIPSTAVNIEVKLDAPTSFRPRTYTPMTLYYFNNGTNDVELYELMITIEYGYIAATMDELDRNKQKVLHVRPDFERNSRGYISLPPGERIAYTFFVYNGENEVNDLIVYVVK